MATQKPMQYIVQHPFFLIIHINKLCICPLHVFFIDMSELKYHSHVSTHSQDGNEKLSFPIQKSQGTYFKIWQKKNLEMKNWSGD